MLITLAIENTVEEGGSTINGFGGRLRGLVLQPDAGQVLEDVERGATRGQGEEGILLICFTLVKVFCYIRICFEREQKTIFTLKMFK